MLVVAFGVILEFWRTFLVGCNLIGQFCSISAFQWLGGLEIVLCGLWFILFTASFWTVEEVDLSKDMTDWNRLKVCTAYKCIHGNVRHLCIFEYNYSVFHSLRSSTSSSMCWLSLLPVMA